MRARVCDGALVEFVYESRADGAMPAAALIRLARQCWARNTRAGLTGELRFADGAFWQVIEGAWPDVMAVASSILTDPRHSDIAIHAFGPIRARRFVDWRAIGFPSDVGPDEADGAGSVARLPARPGGAVVAVVASVASRSG